MSVFKSRRIVALTILAAFGCPLPAGAQVALPPNLIKQQAEREKNPHPSPAADQAAAPGGARPATESQAARIDSLRTAALSSDPAASSAALRELRSMGQPARKVLRDVVRQLLTHDRAVIQAAHGLPSPARLRELSEKILAERVAARANIDILAHDKTIQIAHDHYNALKPLREELEGSFEQTEAILFARSRRETLRTIWRDTAPDSTGFGEEEEAKLDAQAQKTVALTASEAASIPEFGTGEKPAEPILRDLWFYRACRRIEAFNAALKVCMTKEEYADFAAVNAYRRCLGVLPYEIDPRLVASARGHSKEMVDLKYFAHESPVPANKTPWDRIHAAGYAGGSGENIAAGTMSGEQAFAMWFDSPGHHKNMASPGNIALGVGQVGDHWTQNMGVDPRRLLGSAEDRKAAIAAAKLSAPKGS
ncbi:MAG: Transporter [Phycisphaerales bacterium]|nr:Transporter [Phycisphaerales bacterium]